MPVIMVCPEHGDYVESGWGCYQCVRKHERKRRNWDQFNLPEPALWFWADHQDRIIED